MNQEGKTIRIGFADDHTMLRKSIAAHLNSQPDFDVICEGKNGRELLDAVYASSEKPHVCILDVSMPVMNGYDTLVELKKNCPEILVLVLTMIDHHGNFLRMIHAGADGYMLKDEDLEELSRAIRFMVANGFYNNPNATRLPPYLTNVRADKLQLSERDEFFLRLCASELSFKEIAAVMNVTVKAVEGYRTALSNKLGVQSRTGLAFYALQTGLIAFGYESETTIENSQNKLRK